MATEVVVEQDQASSCSTRISDFDLDSLSSILTEFDDILERKVELPPMEEFLMTVQDQSIHLRDWLKLENRLNTFVDWPYDDVQGAVCTSEKLALSGFMMTSSEQFCAKCILCDLELCLAKSNPPSERHLAYRPNCLLANMKKSEKEFLVSDVVDLCIDRVHHHNYPDIKIEALQDLWLQTPPAFQLDRKVMDIYLGNASGAISDAIEDISSRYSTFDCEESSFPTLISDEIFLSSED
ncbi:unnamed protein product [Bursaphelenchus xylophilus]|uniref:(pine wood nematode) hypothetical protein n=1 Tax=Bursaphelenchus xylophilus TaxID=6326 RepID=A0A1I7S5T8_BURXY|nr:unnamed protein product [Bursaphelenchus xylophilus]CAG9125057.1 unnamed protein product [Bursaphelenchus xylophilus]